MNVVFININFRKVSEIISSKLQYYGNIKVDMIDLLNVIIVHIFISLTVPLHGTFNFVFIFLRLLTEVLILKVSMLHVWGITSVNFQFYIDTCHLINSITIMIFVLFCKMEHLFLRSTA
jgi:hypothetical protein